jgi:hypothetical protein
MASEVDSCNLRVEFNEKNNSGGYFVRDASGKSLTEIFSSPQAEMDGLRVLIKNGSCVKATLPFKVRLIC